MTEGSGDVVARIRTIKPEFWSDEKIASLSCQARLLSLALLNYADDEGYFNANKRLILVFAFPMEENLDICPLLEELEKIAYIERRQVPDRSLGRVVNFKKHQVISHPQPSSLRSLWRASGGNSGSVTGTLPEDSGNIPWGKEGKGRERKGIIGGTPDGEEDLVSEDGPARKARRAPFTPPSKKEISDFAITKGWNRENWSTIEFFEFYASKGWLVGRTRMKDWKLAAQRAFRDGWTVKRGNGGPPKTRTFVSSGAEIAAHAEESLAKVKAFEAKETATREGTKV